MFGLYDDSLLIGLSDIVRDYPKKGTWTIGYLLIHPKYRGQGLGSQLIGNLEQTFKPSKLRCVVQKQNTRALAFWESNQFLIVTQKKDKIEGVMNITYVLEKR